MKTIAKIISANCRRAVARPRFFLLFSIILVSNAATGAVHADPWLDRVEKKLRFLQSSSEHIERAQIGSSKAAKHHRDCVRAGVESSCDQIIWRDPNLGEIRDWAVGVAHIKRAEIREERGDVVGAIQDYEDSLKYHRYPLVPERVANLKSVLAKVEAEKLSTATEAAKAAATRASLLTKQSSEPRSTHPVVVLEGWSASFAALQSETTEAAPKKSAPLKTEDAQSDQADAEEMQDGVRPNEQARAQPSSPTPSRSTIAKALQSYAPGRNTDVIAKAAIAEAAGPPYNQPTSAEGGGGPGSDLAPPTAGQGAAVTTGSLPLVTRQQPSAVLSLMLIGLLLAGLALAAWHLQGSRVFAGSIKASQVPRIDNPKLALSRRDIETMVKRRNSAAAVRVQPTQRATIEVPKPFPPSAAPALKKQTSGAPPSPQGPGKTSKPKSEKTPPPTRKTKPSGTTVTARPVIKTPSPPPRENMPASVAKTISRVPHGAASVIAIESGSNIIRQLFDTVPQEKREALRARYIDLKTANMPLVGLLNIFVGDAMRSSTDWQRRQQLNSVIEMQTICLSAVLGPDFMNANRIALRHLLQLMQHLPDAGMETFLDLLRARTMKKYDEALSQLDTVAARMFFTTEFLSSDFARQRDYMVAKVDGLLKQASIQRLLSPQVVSDDIRALLNDGAFICLDSQSITDDINHQRFLTFALLARLAMLKVLAQTESEREVATAIVIDSASDVFSPVRADADFLIDEADRSGFSATLMGAAR
jgi:hypothetical protein